MFCTYPQLRNDMAKKKFQFESALQELENLVEEMEKGDMSLEDTLKHFEQGISLTRACQQALKKAEQQVEILIQKSGNTEIQPFDSTN